MDYQQEPVPTAPPFVDGYANHNYVAPQEVVHHHRCSPDCISIIKGVAAAIFFALAVAMAIVAFTIPMVQLIAPCIFCFIIAIALVAHSRFRGGVNVNLYGQVGTPVRPTQMTSVYINPTVANSSIYVPVPSYASPPSPYYGVPTSRVRGSITNPGYFMNVPAPGMGGVPVGIVKRRV